MQSFINMGHDRDKLQLSHEMFKKCQVDRRLSRKLVKLHQWDVFLHLSVFL